MNNQHLSNTNPPVIDFLAFEESQPTSEFIKHHRRRAAEFVADARLSISRLASRPERLKAVRALLGLLHEEKPKPISDKVWWSEPHTFHSYECKYKPLPLLPFTGFKTGMATINSIRIEGWDAPEAPQNDIVASYKHRAAKDNRFIGDGEEATTEVVNG
jgi:hypothetical protein